jgi:hypothetical protein
VVSDGVVGLSYGQGIGFISVVGACRADSVIASDMVIMGTVVCTGN